MTNKQQLNIDKAEIWGPHYWYILHTLAYYYPEVPNPITKRKYYDVIMNMPLFIPDVTMGNKFNEMLNNYPLSPYLDNRESFMRWVNFIHNKYNDLLGKREYSFIESVRLYENMHKPKTIRLSEKLKINKNYLFVFIVLCLLYFIYIYS